MSLKRSMLASASAVPTGIAAERTAANSQYETVYGMSQFGMFDGGYGVEVVPEYDYFFPADHLRIELGGNHD